MEPRLDPALVLRPVRAAPLVDQVLSAYAEPLGRHFTAYRNHVCRVVAWCELLCPLSDVDRRQLQIAACFHDLGIWTARTFDYLAPSCALASAYLEQTSQSAYGPQVLRIITYHHKLRRAPDRLTECFRRADLVDLSLGLRSFGVPRSRLHEIKQQYPNAGFHAALGALFMGRLVRRPWSPLPMLRW